MFASIIFNSLLKALLHTKVTIERERRGQKYKKKVSSIHGCIITKPHPQTLIYRFFTGNRAWYIGEDSSIGNHPLSTAYQVSRNTARNIISFINLVRTTAILILGAGIGLRSVSGEGGDINVSY